MWQPHRRTENTIHRAAWSQLKNTTGQCLCPCCLPHLADPSLVCHSAHHGPHAAEDITTGRPCFHRTKRRNTICRACHSWWQYYQAQYRTHLQRWLSFCHRREIDLIQPSNCVLEFLHEQLVSELVTVPWTLPALHFPLPYPLIM